MQNRFKFVVHHQLQIVCKSTYAHLGTQSNTITHTKCDTVNKHNCKSFNFDTPQNLNNIKRRKQSRRKRKQTKKDIEAECDFSSVLQTINTTISHRILPDLNGSQSLLLSFYSFLLTFLLMCAQIFNSKQPLSPLKIYQHKLPKDNQILQIEQREEETKDKLEYWKG